MTGLLFIVAWIGHAVLPVRLLNFLYGCPLPKGFLKIWRMLTGLFILAFPVFAFLHISDEVTDKNRAVYGIVCFCIAVVILPYVTLGRLFRTQPTAVLKQSSTTHDFGQTLGAAAIGDGKHTWLARLPFNDVFKVEFSELALQLKWLPKELNGLTVLVLSDLHFHGTPSRAWFEALFEQLATLPTPDVVALVGDYVDTDTHREWMAPLLGRLKWNEIGLAILGNHDLHHDPAGLRAELVQLGFTVPSNRWETVLIRGVPVTAIGHEGPWFRPAPDLSTAPLAGFRICLSHTPDNFFWACGHMVDLMVCGHVHGGGIRVPLIGSIFVPSIYGRRFDQGMFQQDRTVMAVSRGLSGREPIRLRCKPQVLRLTLTPT